jgi:hypothetical protein
MKSGIEGHQIEESAAELAAEIQALYPALSVNFMIHRRGQRNDQITKTLSSFNGHPAFDAARDLLKSRAPTEQSAFLGIAVGHERGLFGMKGKASCLAFITLNIDQYATREEAQYGLFHLTSQLFDLMSALKPEALRDGGEIILQQKRSPLMIARSNMKADIFSALMMTTQGHTDAIQDLARVRGMQSLIAQAYQRPEEFPYPISVDVTEYAAKQANSAPAQTLLKTVNQLSGGVAHTFDKSNIESWTHFTSPAQTMAWSGSTPDQILGAAIHSCPNPFIKSIGNLIAEVTHIDPAPKDTLQSDLNPYVDIEINQIAHERQIDETFEMVMIHSMEADSSLPLIRVANNQNESILKGKMMGWCAHALHASAKAYDLARQRGTPADQAARLEFESAKNQTDWNTLHRVHDHVLSQRRNGFAVTMGELASWCKTSVDFRPIMESINVTLADPTYSQKLAAVNEMPAPAPGMIQSAAPQNAFAPMLQPLMAPGLSLGGGGMMAGGGTVSTHQQKTHIITDEE